MRNKSNSFVGMTIFVLIVFVATGFNQELTSNIVLGQSLSIDSKNLNEEREVYIYTPEGYEQEHKRITLYYMCSMEKLNSLLHLL